MVLVGTGHAGGKVRECTCVEKGAICRDNGGGGLETE